MFRCGACPRRVCPHLVEEKDHFVLRADLPGLSEDDVNVELEDNVLTISGQRQSEHEDGKDGCYAAR